MIQLPRVRCQLVSHTLSEWDHRTFTMQSKSAVVCVQNIPQRSVFPFGGTHHQRRPSVFSGKWQIALTPAAVSLPQGRGGAELSAPQNPICSSLFSDSKTALFLTSQEQNWFLTQVSGRGDQICKFWYFRKSVRFPQ